jgi:surface polysaccharide O-acyltransferase-like enzyme
MHSFTIYGHSWTPPAGFIDIKPYFWITRLSYSSMLETFVFISGYLLAYQVLQDKLTNNFWTFAKKKTLRLLLPCLLFSVIYFLMFSKYDISSIKKFVYFGSFGHLWFLPMLFWCYLIGYLIGREEKRREEKRREEKRRDYLYIIISIVLVSLSFLPLPFRMGSSLYYLFFFILGMVIFRNREKIIKRFVSIKNILLLGLVFVITFIAGTLLKERLRIANTDNIFEKVIIIEISRYAQLVYATVGLLLTYLIVNYILEKKNISIPKWLFTISTYSFGIYIFQQFILQLLYYKTSLPVFAGAYWLPWIGFAITMFLSIIFTKYTLKTKFGRFLIG